MTAANVIHCIRRDREPVCPVLFFRSSLHHTDNTFDNIIHIREVSLAMPMIEDLDRLSCQKLIRKSEVRHIRTARRTIHRKEAKTRTGDVVQLRIAMSQKLIRLLRRRIERYRMIHFILRVEGHLRISTIDRRRRRIDQMLHTRCAIIIRMAACLQDVIKSDKIRLDIDIRIRDRIPHPCLRRQIYHDRRLVPGKDLSHQCLIRNIPMDEYPLTGR